jgi:hypothetical protein
MNVLCFSFKSKNKGLSSKSKKNYSMGKRKGTIGQTMIYKNKLQRKLKTEKQELKIRGELGCIRRAKLIRKERYCKCIIIISV